MMMRYFSDTDTLSIDFREELGPVFDTIDGPAEDFLLHFDENGSLVGLLIEHASYRTDLENLRSQPQSQEFEPKVKA